MPAGNPYAYTSYGPGNTSTVTQGMDTGLGQGAATGQLNALMRLKLASMARPDTVRSVTTVRQTAPPMAPGREGPSQYQAPDPHGGKVPMYMKAVGGPNKVGGYMRASAGDPDAFISGYYDPRSLPNNAALAPGAGAQESALRQETADRDFARFQAESGADPRLGTGGPPPPTFYGSGEEPQLQASPKLRKV